MNPPSVSSRYLLLAAAAFVAVASWCGYWLYALREAQARVAAFETNLKADGLAIGCGSRSWGGFPFRIVMRCAPFSVRAATADAGLIISRAEFLAQAYDLDHIIAIAGSPAELRRQEGVATIDFGRAVASHVGNDDDEVLIAVDALASTPALAARRLSLHIRRSASQPSQLDFDIAAHDVSFEVGGYGKDKLDRFSAHGSLPTPDLESWPAEGTLVDVRSVELASGDILVRGKGRIGLDSKARFHGRIGLDIPNLRQLLDRLAGKGVIAPDDTEAGLAFLTLLGEGGATTIDLRAEHGRIYFGPFRLGKLPPVR